MSEFISIFLPSYSPIGVVHAMSRLGMGLRAKGFAAELVVIAVPVARPYTTPYDIPTVHLESKYPTTAVDLVKGYLMERKPDAIIAATAPAALAALRGREICRMQTPLVVSLHSQLSKLLLPEFRGNSEQLIHEIKTAFLRADAVTTVSSGVADNISQLIGLQREKIRVIYNGIDIAESLRRASKPARHHWFDNDTQGPPVVMGVGRLTAEKNFPLLLQAVSSIRRTREARLIILGNGPQYQELLQLATHLGLGDDFSLPGYVEDVLPFIRRANVVALSSNFEGLPNVILESLAVGTPVVSTDCPSGPDELLENGVFGELVPVGDAAALSNAILRTLARPLAKERLIERAGAFSLERMVNEYTDILFCRNVS